MHSDVPERFRVGLKLAALGKDDLQREVEIEEHRPHKAHLILKFVGVDSIAQAEALAKAGYATGASQRNWSSYSDEVVLPPGLPRWRRTLLTDPQTSGGLLVACAAARAESIRAAIEGAGYPRASIIGSVASGEAVVRIA